MLTTGIKILLFRIKFKLSTGSKPSSTKIKRFTHEIKWLSI